MSLFDAPLHFRFGLQPCRQRLRPVLPIFDDTLTQKNPMQSVTFVENQTRSPASRCSHQWNLGSSRMRMP